MHKQNTCLRFCCFAFEEGGFEFLSVYVLDIKIMISNMLEVEKGHIWDKGKVTNLIFSIVEVFGFEDFFGDFVDHLTIVYIIHLSLTIYELLRYINKIISTTISHLTPEYYIK